MQMSLLITCILNLKIMKVVIYGATGWLGKSTINHLLNINKDVDLILIASKRKKLLKRNQKGRNPQLIHIFY